MVAHRGDMVAVHRKKEYCKFKNFREGFISAKLRIREVSWKLNPHEKGKHSVITDVGKSCQSGEFLTWQICLLALFAKIKFS